MSDAASAPATLTPRPEGDGVLAIEVSGNWLDRSSLPDVKAILGELEARPVQAIEFDTRQLGRWDSALIVRIMALHDYCAKANVEFRVKSLPEGLAKLIALAQAVPEKKDAARDDKTPPVLDQIGNAGLGFWRGTLDMFEFIGACLLAFANLIRGRAQIRWIDILQVMQDVGPRALPIVGLINFLIGLILAFVGATELAQFGAAVYTADLVAVATVREMACIMTGIILCGRTGAAFAAQIGTMKVNQEVEALQTFGIAPIEFLVLPRMLALIVMMPILCVFADLISILGGYFVSTLMLDISPTAYVNRTLDSIRLGSFLLGIFKGSFFGVLIALSGCMRGMQCGTNAAAVGLATTSAVVTGITSIIASDGLFAVLCSKLGI